MNTPDGLHRQRAFHKIFPTIDFSYAPFKTLHFIWI